MTLLIVCTANVCRSPAAAATIANVVGAGLAVESAGIRARSGVRVCERVRDTLRTPERTIADAHRSRQLDIEQLTSADLILAMTTELRGELIRVSPQSRLRVFTLREAAHLGREFDVATHTDPAERLTAYAAALDTRRRSLRARTVDIVDGHGASARRHRRAISEVRAAAAEVATQILGTLTQIDH